MINTELLEQKLSELPILQYAWISTDELMFTERVRLVCEMECPRYNKSWACPPAVGTVEECKRRCLAFPHAFVLTTATEVDDITDWDATLATRAGHEAITRQAADIIRAQAEDVFVLSTESCAHCTHCTWPNAPCRHPERMFPCVESHGILATDIAEKCGIEFYSDDVVTWFSLILFR